MKFLCVLLSKPNFTTTNKERCLLAKSRCFDLNKFFTSSGIKGKNIVPESIAFSFCDMLHFIRQSLVAKVMQSEMFEIQNKFFPGTTERSISRLPLKIITFLRGG